MSHAGKARQTEAGFEVSEGGGSGPQAPRAVLTLSDPSCSPCTAGTWAWGSGWSPPPGTFFLPERPGRDPSLLAAGETQLQGHADDNTQTTAVPSRGGCSPFSTLPT